MDATELRDAVRDDMATELSRLGSSKALYAATGGELEGDRVLEAAADADRAAAEAFEAWADDETDERAAEVFADVAATEREHVETIGDELDEYVPGNEVPPLPAYLREVEGTTQRAGALLARVLVESEAKSQYTGYFVGEADPQTASTLRGVAGDLDDQEERALALLDDLCADEDDWATAEEAALDAVEAAYEAHVETLESLGVDPKPVC